MYFWGTTMMDLTIPLRLELMEEVTLEELMVVNHGFHLPLDLKQMNLMLPYAVLLMLHLNRDEVALALVERDEDGGVVEDEGVMGASLEVVVVEEYGVPYGDGKERVAVINVMNEFGDENDVQSLLLELY